MRAGYLLLFASVLANASPPAPAPPPPPPPPRAPPIELRLKLELPKGAAGVDPREVLAVVLDRVTVTRDVALPGPATVFAAGSETSPLRHVDQVELWLAWAAVGASAGWPPSVTVYTERSFKTRTPLAPTGPSGFMPRAGHTTWLQHQVWVPIGTRELIVELARGQGRVQLELEKGAARLFAPDGSLERTVVGTRIDRAASAPAYQRITVNERFPGVGMIQAGPCVRYFDLAVDDVYVARGGGGRSTADELVVDATFLQRAQVDESHPDCHRHVDLTNGYAFLVLGQGLTEEGRPPDARIETFGARSLRRVRLDPGTSEVLLGFGQPPTPSDLLKVDLAGGTVTVLRRSAAQPVGKALQDLSGEWLDRERNPRRYWLRKYVRGALMRTEPDGWMDGDDAACTSLARLVSEPYQPGGEAEPLRETWRLFCDPKNR